MLRRMLLRALSVNAVLLVVLLTAINGTAFAPEAAGTTKNPQNALNFGNKPKIEEVVEDVSKLTDEGIANKIDEFFVDKISPYITGRTDGATSYKITNHIYRLNLSLTHQNLDYVLLDTNPSNQSEHVYSEFDIDGEFTISLSPGSHNRSQLKKGKKQLFLQNRKRNKKI